MVHVQESTVRMRIGPDPGAIAIEGELDISTIGDVAAVFTAVEPDAWLLIDLRNVTLVSAAALTAFMREAHRRRRVGGQLVVANARPSCRRVFEVTGMEWLLA